MPAARHMLEKTGGTAIDPVENRNAVMPAIGDVDARAGTIERQMAGDTVAGKTVRQGRDLVDCRQGTVLDAQHRQRAGEFADEYRERQRRMEDQVARTGPGRRRIRYPTLAKPVRLRITAIGEYFVGPEIDMEKPCAIGPEANAMRVRALLTVPDGPVPCIVEDVGIIERHPGRGVEAKHRDGAIAIICDREHAFVRIERGIAWVFTLGRHARDLLPLVA